MLQLTLLYKVAEKK